MPEPSWVRARAPSTRWKRSKSRGSSSSGMPVPVSLTVSTASFPSTRGQTVTFPSKVNFSALERRLRTTRSHMSRST